MSDQKEKPPLRIVTHEMATVTERRRMPKGLNERANKDRPSYAQKRTWTNSPDDMARRSGKGGFHVPEWLLPKNGVHVWNTITASIVWGICGGMSDMDDNQRELGWETGWYRK